MKSIKFIAVATIASLAFIGGCNKSAKSDMGAMGKEKCSDKAGCCEGAKAKEGAMGTVNGQKSECCKSKEASMGTVNGKSSCSADKSACTKDANKQ
jgi:hypothetical protein